MKDNILTVTDAKYLHGYVLLLTYSNGESKEFDFSKVYGKGICQKLKNMEYFRRFKLDPFTIDWNDEIGFAPEFLYENS